MKRYIAGLVFILAAGAAGAAGADDLAAANNALSSKNYPLAQSLYARLAGAGNADAALRLGEMYWYGEGVPLDRAKGDVLFAQAAAAGNQAAVAATALTRQRQQHLADITFWTTSYDGADLVAGKFNCVAPVFTPHTETKRAVTAIAATSDAYTACYNGFIENLEQALPLGKLIPENVALLMSEQELSQAREHLGKVYAAVAARGKLTAEQVIAQRDKWMAETTVYLTNQKLREEQYLLEMNRQRSSNAAVYDLGTRKGK